MMAKTKSSGGPKKLLLLIILLVIVAGALGYGYYRNNLNPVVEVPEPNTPRENSIDMYVSAQMMKVRSLFVHAGPAGHFLNLTDVCACIHAGKIAPNPAWGKGARPPRLADMQALMAKNAPVFAMVKQGFGIKFVATGARFLSQSQAYLLKQPDLARTMLADGNVKCASGQWDAGAERFVDIIRLGGEIPHGGALLALQAGADVEAIGRSEAWYTLNHISGAEARQATRRLEEIADKRVPYADVLQEEKWAMQAELLDLFSMPDWRANIEQLRLLEGVDPGENSFITSVRMEFTGKRAIMANYTRYMDTLITRAKQPYPAVKTSPPAPKDPVCQMFIPYISGAWIRDAVTRAQHHLLTTSFALRAYQADHGKYPADLKALVPAYLQAIPADPFTANGILQYKVTGKSYVLYSVGPDGKDDGGTPSADGKDGGPGVSTPSLRIGSMGDIVAGVNIH